MTARKSVHYIDCEEPKHNYPALNYNIEEDTNTTTVSSTDHPQSRLLDKYIQPKCTNISKCYITSVLAGIGLFIVFSMRSNLSLAMTVDTFYFEHMFESDVLFFSGFVISQIPGGILAFIYPANRVFAIAIACTALANLFLPTALTERPISAVVLRCFQGLSEGVTYPALHGVWRYWAPRSERARLVTFAFFGAYIGLEVGAPISSYLISRLNWKAPFYFYGSVGLFWCLIWLWLIFETPHKDPLISIRELKKYFEDSNGSVKIESPSTLASIPWKSFFTSLVVFVIMIASFCKSWNFYFLVLYHTEYLIKETSLNKNTLKVFPLVTMILSVPLGGIIADNALKRKAYSLSNIRKLSTSGGFGIQAIIFFMIIFSENPTKILLLLTLGMMCSGFSIAGFNVNHIDIAPRYASILMGLSNCMGSMVGFILPSVMDIIKIYRPDAVWEVMLVVSTCVNLFAVVFYGVFASAEEQPWAEPLSDT